MGLPMQGPHWRVSFLLPPAPPPAVIQGVVSVTTTGDQMKVWSKKAEKESRGRGVARAALAVSALEPRRGKEEESKLAGRQHVLLEYIREPLLLLDDSWRITAASRGARELTGPAYGTEGPHPAGIPAQAYLPELFRERDRAQIEAWLRAGLGREAERHGANHEPFRAELQNGVGVRLCLAASPQGRGTVILLQPLVTRESAGQPGYAEIELQNVIEWLEEGVVLFDAQDNVRAMNTRFEQIAGLSPEESGKIKTLEALIERLQSHAAEPALFAERWRELARGIEGGVREELQMMHPAPRILERAARPVLDPIGRLLARQQSPARTEEVRQIYQEAERARTILRQLLLNVRETPPERRLVSLNQIVHRAMDLQRFSLAAEKIRVQIDLDPALPFIQGDPGHLQQVLMNLVGNARQAIEEHGQDGTIRLRTRKIGQRRVLLEIADDGPGIPQAILARIFDPFFTTKPAGVGTGLGLAIVLSAVREHGGQVHVVSPPQGGAIFQIEFPAAAATAQAEAMGSPLPRQKHALPEGTEAMGRENRLAPAFETRKVARVLVVDDEPTVARLIADVLEDEGMRVEVLLDGREALDCAARQTFDLVICDMKMPGLDGQHFYNSLERSGNPLRERFLFVTGDIIAAQTREFLERNHLPYVAKPFRVEELTEKVHSVLAIAVHQQPPPAAAARKKAARNG